MKARAGIWVEECGSLHAVYEDDEDAVLREFTARAEVAGVRCTYLRSDEVMRRFPAINPSGLKGGLFSPTELAVNPPEVIARIAKFLVEQHGVRFQPDTAIVGVDMPHLTTAAGEQWRADQVFICSGSDFPKACSRQFTPARG